MSGVESAVVYLRISEDRTGLQAGVNRQLEDCERLATRRGLAVAAVLIDNDRSAFDGTRRPGYETLLGHVRAGVSRIVVWHLDRLYRRPRELEALIDLVEDRSLRIETVHGGPLELNSHEGRLMARQFVAIAAYESGHKADRVARAMRQRAATGAWHGLARYGYGTGGALIPEQAAVIRQMADRFLGGESIRAITAWLNTTTPPPGKAARCGRRGRCAAFWAAPASPGYVPISPAPTTTRPVDAGS
ncbi:MAG: recombinase family protein [Nocardioides sp.]|uniref:recombinase family protein n=1 Tax=Nocardioides sp. TaxID=35761 RepID=UPI0039E2ECCE